MKNLNETTEIIKGLLWSQKLAVLATHNHGQPYSNLMAFAVTDDLKYFFFATTRATRKYSNLMADSRVSLLVDNRANEEADFSQAAAVTALGQAWELQGLERQQSLKIFLDKHPYLQDFVSSPSCALLRVKVEKYILVTRFQEVREIQLTS
ncbi:MAG: pyridoxamine 5'-phosphate oxidase family protein [Desulfobacteraceae bacterium]